MGPPLPPPPTPTPAGRRLGFVLIFDYTRRRVSRCSSTAAADAAAYIYTTFTTIYITHIIIIIIIIILRTRPTGIWHTARPRPPICTHRICVYNNNGTLFRTHIYMHMCINALANTRKTISFSLSPGHVPTIYNISRFLDSCFIDVNSPTNRHTPHIRRSLAPRIALLHVLDVPPNRQPQTRCFIYIL